MKIVKQFVLRRAISGYPYSRDNHSILPARPTCAGKKDFYRFAVFLEPGEQPPEGIGRYIPKLNMWVGRELHINNKVLRIHARTGEVKAYEVEPDANR